MAEDENTSPERKHQRLDPEDPQVAECIRRYWRRNVALLLCLLAVWAATGLGCGILWADTLNTIRVAGFRVGFWFAHQGAIAIFILLSLAYCLIMNRLDRVHQAELENLGKGANAGAKSEDHGEQRT